MIKVLPVMFRGKLLQLVGKLVLCNKIIRRINRVQRDMDFSCVQIIVSVSPAALNGVVQYDPAVG